MMADSKTIAFIHYIWMCTACAERNSEYRNPTNTNVPCWNCKTVTYIEEVKTGDND